MQAVSDGGIGNELPHALGVAFAGDGSGDERVEVAFLEGKVEKLTREAARGEGLGDGAGVALLLGEADVAGEAIGRLPLFDIAQDLSLEVGRDVDLALTEDAGDADDEPVLLGVGGLVDLEGLEESVVARLHVAAAVLILVDLQGAALRVGGERTLLDEGDLYVEHLHGVEDLAGGLALVLTLFMQAPGVEGGGGGGEEQHGDDGCEDIGAASLSFLLSELRLSLNLDEGAADQLGVLARRLAGGGLLEVVGDDSGFARDAGGSGLGRAGWRGLEEELGAVGAEVDALGGLEQGGLDAGAVAEEAVGAVKVTNEPALRGGSDFGVDAADEVVGDDELAGGGAADAEGLEEAAGRLAGGVLLQADVEGTGQLGLGNSGGERGRLHGHKSNVSARRKNEV